jgi:hypothetical protein
MRVWLQALGVMMAALAIPATPASAEGADGAALYELCQKLHKERTFRQVAVVPGPLENPGLPRAAMASCLRIADKADGAALIRTDYIPDGNKPRWAVSVEVRVQGKGSRVFGGHGPDPESAYAGAILELLAAPNVALPPEGDARCRTFKATGTGIILSMTEENFTEGPGRSSTGFDLVTIKIGEQLREACLAVVEVSDPAKVPDLVERLGGIAVRGKVTIRELRSSSGVLGDSMHSYTISVNMKILDLRTGNVLGTVSDSYQALGVSPEVAVKKSSLGSRNKLAEWAEKVAGTIEQAQRQRALR